MINGGFITESQGEEEELWVCCKCKKLADYKDEEGKFYCKDHWEDYLWNGQS
jgi:hypothetical protein